MATLPDATVDTITLGTPTGRARIAGVIIAVPPDPPIPTMPVTSSRDRTYASSAAAIAATAVPRSSANTASVPSGWHAATAAGPTSPSPNPGGGSWTVVPTSTTTASTPRLRTVAAT